MVVGRARRPVNLPPLLYPKNAKEDRRFVVAGPAIGSSWFALTFHPQQQETQKENDICRNKSEKSPLARIRSREAEMTNSMVRAGGRELSPAAASKWHHQGPYLKHTNGACLGEHSFTGHGLEPF